MKKIFLGFSLFIMSFAYANDTWTCGCACLKYDGRYLKPVVSRGDSRYVAFKKLFEKCKGPRNYPTKLVVGENDNGDIYYATPINACIKN